MIKKLIERFKEKYKSKMYMKELLNTEYEIPSEVEELAESFNRGYFNFRLIEKETRWTDADNKEKIEYYYEIHDVYYNDKDEIVAWSEEPTSLYLEYGSDVEDLINHITEASSKKILKIIKDSDDEDELIELNKYIKDIK